MITRFLVYDLHTSNDGTLGIYLYPDEGANKYEKRTFSIRIFTSVISIVYQSLSHDYCSPNERAVTPHLSLFYENLWKRGGL